MARGAEGAGARKRRPPNSQAKGQRGAVRQPSDCAPFSLAGRSHGLTAHRFTKPTSRRAPGSSTSAAGTCRSHYGSQIEEHHAVRRDAGMFDVSHMCPVDVRGADTRAFLRYLVANNVDRLTQPGKALYSCMLNHAGGVVDDLIIYFLRDDWFRVVVNASTADKDLAWMEKVRMERALRRHHHAAPRPRDDRDPGAERAREVLAGAPGDESGHRSSRRVLRGRSRRPLRRAHRLHRRGRLRGDAAGRRRPTRCGPTSRPRASPKRGSARATRCGWKPA